MPFWESQQVLTAYQWIFRAVVVFTWLFVMTKLMGQREIGRLTLFDFVIAITIGSVSAGSLGNSQTDLNGVLLTTGTLALLNIIIAVLALKSLTFRRIVQGEPLVLIQNGKLLEDTMRKARINVDDLLMGLRRNKVPNLSDVEFAVLEPNGKISVIPKSQSRNVKPKDLNIDTNYEGFPTVVIEDGNILKDNLQENNLDVDWLKGELENQGVEDKDKVLAAMLDTQGRLYISKKNQKNEELIH
ncbi:YetF domain-containing protein [Acetohalobium arabaticum]|uniref:YetF C-terminal domain-containing protein n=1 Tax=Acetohalobium arabaticum (strain ATCC 49924 / DSM 5501 / Z-7288) TaxID=574087 RepID=D9QPQ6_ACEAZ|nr:DUF421 domain-containing protein [Acetohalobium arabaticum]ADL12497.1 protein of unknown function DUF421 [Acetohalobium arabaticum DSM 5501]